MHHAFFISIRTPSRAHVEYVLSAEGVDLTSHLDFMLVEREVFRIEDAREISIASSEMPVEREHRVIALAFHTITREAQNSLLKTIEEPAAPVKFYVCAPSMGLLLPTLQSRLMKVARREENKAAGGKDHIDQALSEHVEVFFNSSLPERLSLLTEHTSSKSSAKSFISSLIVAIESVGNAKSNSSNSSNKRALKILEDGLRFLSSPSSSQKMILENIAINLSRTKL